MAYLNSDELLRMGFASIGRNVKISDKASIYGASKISIDDYTRIDDFCILSAGEGGITIGKYVHIAPYCSLMGKGAIVLEDFSGLSSKVSIYSSSDDYSGKSMTNPCVPEKFKKVFHGSVLIKKHVIIGTSSVILPNITIGKGAAVGALSLVTKNIPESTIVIGVPAKQIKARKTDLFDLETDLLNDKIIL